MTPAEDATCHQIRGADTPDDLTDDVEVCEAETWFHQGTTKLGNLGATAADSYPTFDENPPGSYQGGNGAGYAAVLGDRVASGQNQPRFEGSFTGTIDTLHVTAYVASPLYEALLGSFPLEFTLVVDGVPVIAYEPEVGEEKNVPLSTGTRSRCSSTTPPRSLRAWTSTPSTRSPRRGTTPCSGAEVPAPLPHGNPTAEPRSGRGRGGDGRAR